MDAEMFKMKDEDFIIRIRPFREKDGEWNGEIDISIITQPSNDLSDEDYYQVMHFCKMMASTVPIMEENEVIRDLVHEYVMSTLDKEYEIELEPKPEVVNREGNVINIDFRTKTKGSA